MNGLLLRFLSRLEKIIANLQGKGMSTSVRLEWSQERKLLKKNSGGIYLDIGGNKGAYTAEILRTDSSAIVVVSEPSAVNVQLLTARFDKRPNVTIFAFGLSGLDAEVNLWTNYSGSGLASVHRRRLAHLGISFDQSEKIRVKAFEGHWISELNSAPIRMAKIDVEGLEMDVLKGFGLALKFCSVIQCEFGGTHIDSRFSRTFGISSKNMASNFIG